MRCNHCFSEQITYFRQYRRDGKAVVTARCINGHSPVKGRPFFPVAHFADIKALPLLPGQKEPTAPERQMSFIAADPIEMRRLVSQDVNRRFPKNGHA